MSNPIYNSFGGGTPNLLLQRINQLKKTISGDPMQHIQRMLNSGQISQEQYNRAVKQAQEIMESMRQK